MILEVIVLILLLTLCAFVREVVIFVLHERKLSSHVFFGKQIPFKHCIAHLPLLTYDLHYCYTFVPFNENLSEWCFELLQEVLTACKKKYPVVTSIHYFRRHNQNVELPLIWQSRSNCDALVIVPLTNAKAKVNNDAFLNSCCILAHPPSTVNISSAEFLLVNTRQCRAWSV
jgi:hypothetical protein